MFLFALKFIGYSFAAIFILFIISFAYFGLRLHKARKASDTIISEYAVSKNTNGLIQRAAEVGFSSFLLHDFAFEKFYVADLTSSLSELSLEKLQKQFDQMERGTLDVIVVPIPPFLRWIVRFEFEKGQVKKIERLQLD